jgi:hypothetical protein
LFFNGNKIMLPSGLTPYNIETCLTITGKWRIRLVIQRNQDCPKVTNAEAGSMCTGLAPETSLPTFKVFRKRPDNGLGTKLSDKAFAKQ